MACNAITHPVDLGIRGSFRLCRVIAMCLAATSSGCSFIYVTPPQEQPDPFATGPDCTRSLAAPVTDTVLMSALVTTAGVLWHKGQPEPEPCFACNIGRTETRQAGVGALLAAAVFGISALHGYRATALCRESDDRYALRSGDTARP